MPRFLLYAVALLAVVVAGFVLLGGPERAAPDRDASSAAADAPPRLRGAPPPPAPPPLPPLPEAYEATTPEDPHAWVVALPPGGEARLIQGRTKDGSRDRSGPQPRASDIRIEADADQAYATLHAALGRLLNNDHITPVALRTHGRTTHRIAMNAIRPRDWRPPVDHQVVCFGFLVDEGVLRLKVLFNGGPWVVERGCLMAEPRIYDWAAPSTLSEIEALIQDVASVCPDAWDARIEAPGCPIPRFSWARAAPVEDPSGGPSVADVGRLLELLVRCEVRHVDLALATRAARVYWRDPITRVLEWLASQQRPDGRWSAPAAGTLCWGRPMPASTEGDGFQHFDTGSTALALEAFLSAGYTNRGKHRNAKSVGRGLKWLRRRMGEDGTFDPVGTPDRALAHALATSALVHAFRSTENPIFRKSAGKALAALPGAWREEPSDPVATAWAALALRESLLLVEDAKERDRKVPWTLDEGIRQEVLSACRALTRGRTELEEAAGIVGCLLLGDGPKDGPFAAAIQRAATLDLEAMDPRALHLYTMAAYRIGGPAWKSWNGRLKPLLATLGPSQLINPCCIGAPRSTPEGLRLPGGRLTTTALTAMAAEIYYRYDRVLGVE